MVTTGGLEDFLSGEDHFSNSNIDRRGMPFGSSTWLSSTHFYCSYFLKNGPRRMVDGVEFKMSLDKGDGNYRRIGRLSFRRGPFFKKFEILCLKDSLF
jgi:hypothetical protein